MSDEKKKKIKLKKRKTTLSSLFNDNRFLMIFSLVMAFIIWVGVSADSGETGNYPITDIPVVMDLSEDAENDNLNVVSIDGVPVDEFTATVRVKGNNVTVGSLTKSDIQVYGANLGNIVTSGTYTVTLLAKQVGIKNNYDIVSLNPSEVTVVVDRNIIKEFTLESMIEASAPSDYYKGNPDFSVKTVSVSGPEQSVQNVLNVYLGLTFLREVVLAHSQQDARNEVNIFLIIVAEKRSFRVNVVMLGCRQQIVVLIGNKVLNEIHEHLSVPVFKPHRTLPPHHHRPAGTGRTPLPR